MFANRIKINLPNRGLMPRENQVAEPVVNGLVIFPAANGVVIGSGEQEVVVWMPLDEFHVLRVA